MAAPRVLSLAAGLIALQVFTTRSEGVIKGLDWVTAGMKRLGDPSVALVPDKRNAISKGK
jgi:hypothetical protein